MTELEEYEREHIRAVWEHIQQAIDAAECLASTLGTEGMGRNLLADLYRLDARIRFISPPGTIEDTQSPPPPITPWREQ